MMVLIHTVIGLVFLVPYFVYQLNHWQDYRGRQLNDVKLTGYVSFGATTVAIISGLFLTYEAAFTTRINYLWDKLHIITTFVLITSILTHILLIVYRDWKARKKDQIKIRLKEESKYGINSILFILVQFTLVALFFYAYTPPSLKNKLPDDYHYVYGKDSPFAPSLATTSSGQAIDSKLLGGSESCGSSGCHEQIGKEWEASAHRYAAMDPAFRAVQKAMGKQKGPEATRYCGGCHDPISLFSGTKNLFNDELTNKTGLNEGISCISCHAIKKADVKGNAEYTLAKPKRYMFELQDGKTAKMISDFLIRAYPKEHIDSYNRPLLKTPEYCGSCHKQFIDKQVNNVGWVQLQNQYDNWRKSRWNHPKEPMKTIECRECHMPLTNSTDPAAGDALDYNRTADDGKHRSHRFLGGNQFVPKLLNLPGADKHVKLVEKWLRGEIKIPEIKNKWRSGRAVPISLLTPDSVGLHNKVSFNVSVTNNKVGHNYPTGPLDVIQSWLKVVVRDQSGRELFSSGTLDDRHFIKKGTFMFKAEPVDENNNIIDRHNLWEMVGVRYSRVMFPGHSDQAHYEFSIDKALKKINMGGKSDQPVTSLTVTAELQYRKMNQYLMNAMFSSELDDPTAPVTTLSSDKKIIKVVPG